MTEGEYKDTQMRLVMIRQLTDGLELEAFLQEIERADTIGVFTNPTLWQQGHRELDKIRDLARALQAFIALPLPAYIKAAAQAEDKAQP